MVFRDEIEPVIHPELRVAPAPTRLSMQQLFDTVRTTHPDAAITRAEIPRSSSQAVLFKLKRRADQAPLLAPIDPYRGRLVRVRGLSAWPVESLFVVHEQFLSVPYV